VKHLAGPPSEFGDLSLPLPSHQAQIQHSATFKVYLLPSSQSMFFLNYIFRYPRIQEDDTKK